MRYPSVLTIAGSDSCGGAGIQADIKAISSLGLYASSVVTAITAQNTTGVKSVMPVTPQVVADQIDMVFADIQIDAVKTGMLYDSQIITTVAEKLRHYAVEHYVLDPVMVSTSGTRLISEDAIQAMVEQLFPLAQIITPNLPEAEALTGIKITSIDSANRAANQLLKTGCKYVLIKGGHREGEDACDLLYTSNNEVITYKSNFIKTFNTHGTGCTLSSAIASYLALGKSVEEAVLEAKNYIKNAIDYGKNVVVGHGHGPVNHFFNPQSLKILDK